MTYRALFGAFACVLASFQAKAEPQPGAGAPDGERCIAHHKEAQVLRGQGSLRAASKQLQSCLHPECSPVLREACAALLDDVERDTPSVVFAAESAGADLTEVRVYDGGALLLGRITGRAVALDPGEHQLRFEAEGRVPLDRTILLRVGEKNRAVHASLQPLQSPPATSPAPRAPLGGGPVAAPYVSPDAEPRRTLSFADYAPFGAGLVIGVGGVVLALNARADLNDAKRTCSPHCSDARQERIFAKSLVADGLFVLTGVAFAYGTIRILTKSPDPSLVTSVVIQPGYVGGRVCF